MPQASATNALKCALSDDLPSLHLRGRPAAGQSRHAPQDAARAGGEPVAKSAVLLGKLKKININ